MLIKICGVKDPGTAFFAASNGAHYVGMILTPGFSRSVPLARAKRIAEAAREGGAEPVAVFVTETQREIEKACDELGIDIVQFYCQSTPLAPRLRRFYVNQPDATLRRGQDYLLIESNQPGSGQKIDPTTFIRPKGKQFFLAGGLKPGNVKEMIALYRPYGVDVSSGVEKRGVKNHDLILEFIEQVKSYE